MLNVHSYLNNQWHPPSANAHELRDAASGKVIARIGHNGISGQAIRTFAKNEGGAALRAMGFHDRAKLLKTVAHYLLEHKETLYTLSYHTGATKKDSWLDIDGGVQTMLSFASTGRRQMPDGQIYVDGDVEELSRDGSFKGVHIATPRLGVAVHINAFNFPVWGMLEKLAPAWLAGMPVIVKPASQTAYLAEAVVRLLVDSGQVPVGAIQMIAGTIDDLLDQLDGQDVVSFTGSAATARQLRSRRNLIDHSVRFIAEQDSLNATILGEDVAVDSPEFAIFIEEVVREMTTKAGQKCTAIRRILVPQTRVDAVIGSLSAKLAKLIIGDPREASSQMGALVSTAQRADVLKKAQQIHQEAELVYGTLSTTLQTPTGAFMTPLLFYCQEPDQAQLVHTVEAFGPVATVMAYRDTAHAIALANRGQGALVTSVVTNSGAIARQIAYQAGAWHGRLYFNNALSAQAATGHGAPLPHMIHGGPGRAGGSEELGGIRGVLHYMQRTAIQGHPDVLTAISGQYVANAARQTPAHHLFTQSYRQLTVGDSITTAQREISLDDIDHFAHFTGDTFYAHMDDAAAQANPFFPGRVAHGYLLLSFAAGLFVEPNPGPVLANTGLHNLSFSKPVSAGEAIYVTLTVKRKTRRTADYGEVCWQVVIYNQDDQAVAQYDLLTMNAYDNPY